MAMRANKLVIIYKKKFLLVFLFNKLFLKQYYVKNKVFTLFLMYHLIYKLGLMSKHCFL
jgi:hypothetical protein